MATIPMVTCVQPGTERVGSKDMVLVVELWVLLWGGKKKKSKRPGIYLPCICRGTLV